MRLLIAFACAAAAIAPGWTIFETRSDARLRGISAPSESVIWASGTGGTVLRSIDAGRTWLRRVIPGTEKLDFRDVDAFDQHTAYALSIGKGDESRIYRTSDGGRSWTLQLANTDPKIFLDAMAFWSPERGIAFSDSVDGQFVVFSTTDGQRWSRLPAGVLPPSLPDEGAYAASGTNVAVQGERHVWIATSRSRVLRSSDSGGSWAVASTPIPTGTTSGIFSIAFRDERHGVIVGGDFEKTGEAIDNAAFTADGGVTWRLAKGLGGYRSVVAHRPGTTTWYAAGPTGVDVSTDDGRTWRPVEGMTGLHTFVFPPAARSAGVGAGDRGTIVRLDP